MIEAIPYQIMIGQTYGFFFSMAGLALGLLTVFFHIDEDSLRFIVLGLAIVAVGVVVFVIGMNEELQYENQIKEQLLTLECEQYQEAYELYQKEFIKTEYQNRCVDDREWWK